MTRIQASFFAGVLLIIASFSSPAHASKTDIVVLANGDEVTGEIKGLEFGSLRYSTDSMGTVNIDWEDITSVQSDQDLQIEMTDGSRYFGSLLASVDANYVRVKTASQEVDVPAGQVVRITPIETNEKFWQNLDGSFSLGFQTQKSSQVTTSNVAADVSHRSRRYLYGLKLTSTVTDQPTEETKARQSVEANFQRFRSNRWFTDWFTRWERNDELGIMARSAAGGALGRYLVQTNMNQFSLTAGIQAARTSYTGEDESATEAEGRVEIRYLRRNLIPETSVTFTSLIYPLIDDLSQFRAETDLSFKREFFSDLFLSVSIGHSYLSDPPADGASSDYSVTTSLGYSF
jgi:hypothetical protein